MAKTKVTKKQLLNEMDEVLSTLNLLRSALHAETSLKQEILADYNRRFRELAPKKK
jgi:hypothetical protein